jgi:hypothetical protein
MDTTSNEANKQAFKQQLPTLRSCFPAGRYALFVGATLIGAYASYAEALSDGYEKAGKAPFFVKQINTPDDEVQLVVSPFTVA